jgi:oxygen-dependent protoporphyrinogen oxidase
LPARDAARSKRYLFLGRELRQLPASWLQFVGSDFLSWHAKWQILSEIIRRRSCPGEDESVDHFARRRFGDEVAEVLVDPLVTGIYGGDPRLLSLQSAFPRFAAMERNHGSILRAMVRSAWSRSRVGKSGQRGRGHLWSFRPGLRYLIETLAERITNSPLLNVNVKTVAKEQATKACWSVHGEGEGSWPADAVILACPASKQAEQLADLDQTLAEEISAIPYNRLVVVALGYRREQLRVRRDGFGYIAPQRLGRNVLGVQWCSSIFEDRAPSGMVLWRAMCGGWNRPDIVDWTDERLLNAVKEELQLAMGIEAVPTFHTIIRWDPAIPQYNLGHGDRLRRIAERLRLHPGLYLAGNAYHGVALNDCIEQARQVAVTVASYLTKLS